MTAAEMIRGALEWLGPNGEHWSERGVGRDNDEGCVIAALNRVVCQATGTRDRIFFVTEPARDLIRAELDEPRSISAWNDDPRTLFSEVQLTLKRALHRAEEAGI